MKLIMKIRSIVEFLLLSGVVFIIYIRNDLIPAIGVAVSIILGRRAAKRYISQIIEWQKKKNINTENDT